MGPIPRCNRAYWLTYAQADDKASPAAPPAPGVGTAAVELSEEERLMAERKKQNELSSAQHAAAERGKRDEASKKRKLKAAAEAEAASGFDKLLGDRQVCVVASVPQAVGC
jgi:hypothetical protein